MRFLRPALVTAFLAISIVAIAQVRSNTRPGVRPGPPQPTPAQAREVALRQLRTTAPDVRVYSQKDKVDRLYGTAFATGFTPEQSAASFVNAYSAVFEPGMGSFQYSGTQSLMDGAFTAVYFRETVMGLPLDQGYLTVLVRNEMGSPVVLVSSAAQTVSAPRMFGSQISAGKAMQIVKQADKTLNAVEVPTMVAYQDGANTLLTWSFRVTNDDRRDMKNFQVYVDAATGRIVEWRDKVYHVNVNGHVDGFATPGLLPNELANPPVQVDLAGLRVRIQGGSNTLTNLTGNFTLTNAGVAPVTVNAALQGQWANVLNDAGQSDTKTAFVIPPGPVNFTFNPTPQAEFLQAQVDGFINVTAVHDFAKSINSSYPGIDLAIPTHVNIASICNAFYTNDTVNFFASETGDGMTGCPNTAYSTVIWHEYGHFVIEHGHQNATSDYHEGMADTNAALLADDPCGGNDFLGQGTGCLRNAVNGVTYPCSDFDPHFCGMVISGAFWGTRVNMVATLGAGPALDHTRYLYLNSILLHPSGINPGITIDVLTLDDDNPIIYDGTPNYPEIAAAFNAKNLTAPVLDTSYAVSSVSTIQGTHSAGGTAEAVTSDDTYYEDTAVLVPGIGFFATEQADFTIAEPPASVSHLFFTVEAHTTPTSQSTGTILIWNWNTSQYEFGKAFSLSSTDVRQYAIITGNVSKYINGSGQVRMAFRAHDPFRVRGQRPQPFTLHTDYIHLHVQSQ